MSSNLTFTFMDEGPSYIHLGDCYSGPKNPKRAEYNIGRGWTSYENSYIPILHENQISFRGDWRDEWGTYDGMFRKTFMLSSSVGEVIMSGTLEYDANDTPFGYAHLFEHCSSIVYMKDNPLPKITGTLANNMLRDTFSHMSGLRILPEGFLDLSEVHGRLGQQSLITTCLGMENLTIPYIFKLGSHIKLDHESIDSSLWGTWSKMRNWTGTVLWGDKILFNQIIPKYSAETVRDNINMIGYNKIHKNWK